MMTIWRLAPVLAVLAVTAAQAQQRLPIETPPTRTNVQADALLKPGPFAEIRKPEARVYGADVAAEPNDHLFKGFRRDPQLVAGVNVAPNLALEAGYVNLPDKGLHRVEQGRAEGASYGLGEKGSSNHVAAKVSTPEDGPLSAYAKAGIAYSTMKRGAHAGSDTGLYTGAGAKYKIDKSTSVSGDLSRHGDAATKFGRNSKDGVKGSVMMGF